MTEPHKVGDYLVIVAGSYLNGNIETPGGHHFFSPGVVVQVLHIDAAPLNRYKCTPVTTDLANWTDGEDVSTNWVRAEHVIPYTFPDFDNIDDVEKFLST